MLYADLLLLLQAFNKRSEKQFDERDQFFLTVVLKQASTPLENAAAFESERRKEIINQNLLDIGLVLSSEHEFQTLSKMIITRAKKLLNADRCSIIFRNPDTQHLYSNMTDGSKTEFTIPEDSIAGNVAKTGKGVNVVDAYLNERFNPEFDEKSGEATMMHRAYSTHCRYGEHSTLHMNLKQQMVQTE